MTAVGGMGGIGKTELAVQAARTALARGWFVGGVLFVDKGPLMGVATKLSVQNRHYMSMPSSEADLSSKEDHFEE